MARDQLRSEVRPPTKYGFFDLVAFALTSFHELMNNELKNYKEAILSTNAKEWKVAMLEEMELPSKNHTWELVPRPNSQRVIDCKWIYKDKE